jgi:hypothetical protein
MQVSRGEGFYAHDHIPTTRLFDFPDIFLSRFSCSNITLITISLPLFLSNTQICVYKEEREGGREGGRAGGRA